MENAKSTPKSHLLATGARHSPTSVAEEPWSAEEELLSVVRDALNIYIERQITDEAQKLVSQQKISAILSREGFLETIRALFIYMTHQQFRRNKDEIIDFLSQQHALLHALFEDNEDIDESFAQLTIDMRKLLNARGIQTVTPFQFQAKIQRRLDSLARILTPHTRFTVCVALTIVADHLYISANYEGSESTICANHIWNRLSLFRDFFKRLPSEYYLPGTFDAYQHDLMQEIERFLPLLNEQGGRGLSQSILTQAVQKSIFACAPVLGDEAHHSIEREAFDAVERFAILDNPEVTLLIPKKVPGQEFSAHKTLAYSEFRTVVKSRETQKVPVNERHHVIGQFDTNLSIRYIHCEQLLIYFLDKIRAVMSPRSSAEINFLRIGISKLCCQTCVIAIDEWNRKRGDNVQIAVRGWHEKTYDRVLNLFDPQDFSHYRPLTPAANGRIAAPAVGAIFFEEPRSLAESYLSPPSSPVKAAVKRDAACIAGGLSAAEISTPKRTAIREEQEGASSVFGCGKPFVSPNTPYEGRGKIVVGLRLDLLTEHFAINSFAFPLSLMKNEQIKEKVEEKQEGSFTL